jgi:hypothetical protein
VFALSFYHDTETVLARRGHIVVFPHVTQAPAIVRRFAPGVTRRCRFGSSRVSLTCDFVELTQFVTRRRKDQRSKVINGLNTLLELVATTRLEVPQQYKKALCALADHTTFSDDLAAFFSFSKYLRKQVLDTVFWCIGAVCMRILIVRK